MTNTQIRRLLEPAIVAYGVAPLARDAKIPLQTLNKWRWGKRGSMLAMDRLERLCELVGFEVLHSLEVRKRQ